jgi:hypothetical protein
MGAPGNKNEIKKGVRKAKKISPVAEGYSIGTVPIAYKIGRTVHHLWPVVTRTKRQGGYYCLLVKNDLSTAVSIRFVPPITP